MNKTRFDTAVDALWGISERLDDIKSAYGPEQREWIEELEAAVEVQEALLAFPVPGWPVGDGTHEHADRGVGPAIDIKAPEGEFVLAAHAGAVEVGVDSACGKWVFIKGERFATKYCHLSTILANTGDLVLPLERIGRVGQTGEALGPHLHFILWDNGVRVAPERYSYS